MYILTAYNITSEPGKLPDIKGDIKQIWAIDFWKKVQKQGYYFLLDMQT